MRRGRTNTREGLNFPLTRQSSSRREGRKATSEKSLLHARRVDMRVGGSRRQGHSKSYSEEKKKGRSAASQRLEGYQGRNLTNWSQQRKTIGGVNLKTIEVKGGQRVYNPVLYTCTKGRKSGKLSSKKALFHTDILTTIHNPILTGGSTK